MKFVILASVLLVAGQSLADKCNTCRGSGCLADNVFQLECTQFVPALPFESQLISNEVNEHSAYGCLDLEYYVGDTIEQIQQCVVSNELSSFCEMLEATLKVESCNVEATGEARSVRSANEFPQVFEDLGSGDSTESTESTVSTISTTETISTTTASSAIHLISLVSLISVIATLLL